MKEHSGITYHWCTKDHDWSGSVKHNGMYAMHEESGHDGWHAEMDARREKNKKGGTKLSSTPTETQASKPADETKTLALSDSLCTALSTHAGVSHPNCMRKSGTKLARTQETPRSKSWGSNHMK